MKNIYVFSILLIVVLSCKKQEEAVLKTSPDITAAIEFYNNASGNNIVKSASLNHAVNPHWNPRGPKWKEAYEHTVAGESIIEVPLTFKYSRGFSLQGIEVKSGDPETFTLRKLVIVKNKNGSHTGFIMTVLDSKGETLKFSDYSYRKIKTDFNGVVLFHDLNDKFITGWRYENGKIKGKLADERFITTPKQNVDGLSLVNPDRECWTVVITRWCQNCTDWYVNGIYDRTACGEKYECGQFSYQECEPIACDDCGSTSGGTGGGSTSSTALTDCMAKADAILAGGVTNTNPPVWNIVAPDYPTANGEINRIVDYKWEFYFGNFASLRWSYTSVDRGIHKKVGNEWHWASFKHFMVQTKGVTPGDTRLNLPSPLNTIRDYNKASVNLKYTVSVTIPCEKGKYADKHQSGDLTNNSYRANFVEN